MCLRIRPIQCYELLTQRQNNELHREEQASTSKDNIEFKNENMENLY